MHPYYPDGRQYPQWDYSKQWVILPNSAYVPMTFPDPVEIPDAVLTEADKEALAKAEEKRLRKQKKHEQPKPTQAAA